MKARAQASRLVETWARRTGGILDLCPAVEGVLINRKYVRGGLIVWFLRSWELGAARNGYVSRLQGRAAEVEDRTWPCI